jgi:hypothetical protein
MKLDFARVSMLLRNTDSQPKKEVSRKQEHRIVSNRTTMKVMKLIYKCLKSLSVMLLLQKKNSFQILSIKNDSL